MILAALAATPRTKRDLAERTGWTTREVELAINAARLEGFPIVSNSDGYFLGTAEQVEQCAARLRRRAANQFVTARALRRTALRMRGVEQRELGLVA